MPSGATWVSRVPEFGGDGGEQPDASHMDSGGMEQAPTVDADGLSSERAGRSSSGVDSTPNAGFPQGPAESAESTPGAASSYSAGSVPPELQRKLIFDEESGRFVSKSRMEQMKLAQELRRVTGQQIQKLNGLVEALGLRCELLTSDLEKLQDKVLMRETMLLNEVQERNALQERLQQLEESVLVVVDGAQKALESVPKGEGKETEDWSDWSLAEDSAFQDLLDRVMKLETSALDGVAFGELYGKLVERVADLEAEGPRGDGPRRRPPVHN